MARENFNACIAEIFAHEGGFVDHPKDPGGATNMGITKATLENWRGRSVSKDEVRNLTAREAEAIYRARYWNWVHGDDLFPGLDLVTFDPAVNSGVKRGVQWLQRAVGSNPDGVMGPATLARARGVVPTAAIQQACANRMGFLRGLGTWTTFGRGWSARVARVEAVATRMAVEATGNKARPVLIDAKERATAKAAREGKAASGTAVAGGGGFTFADIPSWGLIVGGIVLALVIVNMIGRRRHELARAAAMQQVAEETAP